VLEYTPIPDSDRPPWWRTAGYLGATAFMGLFSLVFSPIGRAVTPGASGAQTLILLVGLLACLGLPVLLCWRHRIPFTVTLVTAAVAVVMPIGNALLLVALSTLIGRRRGPAVWWTTAAAGLASAWVVVADSLAQPRGASFWKAWLGPQPSDYSEPYDLPALWVIGIIAAQLAVAISLGLLVRSRREARSAGEAVTVEKETVVRLGDEVARREERERIAREVHDAMGYRLSLLNLHAGALEANSTNNPRVAESARLIRETAAATMDDLRSLLAVLREPMGADQPSVSLVDLAQVVQESFGTSQPLSSSIFIQDAETADPALARAVYRIVQELLTNARKHAPSQPVALSVTGSPSAGVVIETRNRYVGVTVAPMGSSRGLAGISERAQLLGGTVRSGLDGTDFRVRVELPWRTSGRG